MAAAVEPSAAARAPISAHNACGQDPHHGGKTFPHCWDCSSASPYAIPRGILLPLWRQQVLKVTEVTFAPKFQRASVEPYREAKYLISAGTDQGLKKNKNP